MTDRPRVLEPVEAGFERNYRRCNDSQLVAAFLRLVDRWLVHKEKARSAAHQTGGAGGRTAAAAPPLT